MYSGTDTIDGKECTVEILDTGAYEVGKFIVPRWFESPGIIIVYSVWQRSSFNRIESSFIPSVVSASGRSASITIVGNKNDAEEENVSQGKRRVSEQEGRRLAEQCKAHFFEISATNYEEVRRVLVNLIQRMSPVQTTPRVQVGQMSATGIGTASYQSHLLPVSNRYDT